MRSVGIKLLKDKLSEYVRLAAGGEIILVTDRDRVVAELGRPGAGRSPEVPDALLLHAFRNGWIRHPVLVAGQSPVRNPVTGAAKSCMICKRIQRIDDLSRQFDGVAGSPG